MTFRNALMAVCCLALFLCGCQPAPAERRDAPFCPAPAPAYCPPPVAVVEAPVVLPVAGRTVILDAGHGGDDEGAAHYGLLEKDINLDLALRAAAILRSRGVIVHLTRSSDVFVPLPERSAFANRNPNAVLVSVHVNAAPANPDASGVETFVLSGEFKDADRSRQAASRYTMNGDGSAQGKQALANLAVQSRARGPALAMAMQKSLTARLGEPDRGVKPADLSVLRETYFCPAVLVEVGFLTHPRTAMRMRTEDWRRRTAEALAEGICDFLQAF